MSEITKKLNLDPNKPEHMYQLLNAVHLASARIHQLSALRAAKALQDAGWTNPDAFLKRPYWEKVKMMNQNGYSRYDEKTPPAQDYNAHLTKTKYKGDLTSLLKLKPEEFKKEVQGFRGIGPVGADIFLREVKEHLQKKAAIPTATKKYHAHVLAQKYPHPDIKELAKLYVEDQQDRIGHKPGGFDRDKIRAAKALPIIDKHKEIIKNHPMSKQLAWLLIQHMDQDVEAQKVHLPMFKPGTQEYKYLHDRIAVNSGKIQRYGTQLNKKNARPELYGLNAVQKKAEWVHTHDKTLPDGSKLDVLKLIEFLKDRKTIPYHLDVVHGASNSKRSGFSQKRYDKADLKYPLIVDERNFLLDGRHRYLKARDKGRDSLPTRVIRDDELEAIKGSKSVADIIKDFQERGLVNPQSPHHYTYEKKAHEIPEEMLEAANKDRYLKGFIYPKDKTKERRPILTDDGQIAGFMMPRQEHEWRTGAVYVHHPFRGKGLATKAIREFSKDKPVREYIDETNTGSRKAFTNCGFKPYMTDELKGRTKGHWYANDTALKSMGRSAIKIAHELIYGSSGSGKTTLASKLVKEQGGAGMISLDRYKAYKDWRRKEPVGEWTHVIPGTPRNKEYEELCRHLVDRALAHKGNRVIEGTQLSVLSEKELKGHKLHLVNPPLEQIKQQMQERTRKRHEHKGLPPPDEEHIKNKNRFAEDFYNYSKPTIDMWKKHAMQTDDLYIQPELRRKLKEQIQKGEKGGKPGQWSARKSQMLASEYKAQGGAYKDEKHRAPSQHALNRWTSEKWTTHDGKPAGRDGKMHRYLPADAWNKLTPAQQLATDMKKLHGKGQFVPNTHAARLAKTAKSKAKELVETKAHDRNLLTDHTTGLSMSLAHGTVHPVDVIQEINKKLAGNLPEGVAPYLVAVKRQLIFREFANKALQQQTYKFPKGSKGIDSKEWKDLVNEATGIPLVDAAAHDLQTGHKPHNRARLLLARHAIRTENLNPSDVAKWYKKNLDDYDPIINTYNVVQAASGITGSEPAYRKSNAITAAKKLDPHGIYTKTQGFEPDLAPEKKDKLIKRINEGNALWAERWKGFNRQDTKGVPLWPTKDKSKGIYFLQDHDMRAKGHFGSFYKTYLANEKDLLKKKGQYNEDGVPSALWIVKEAFKTERQQKPEILQKERNPSAVIIKGNPRWIKNNHTADRFYNGLADILRQKKYTVRFDKGEPYTSPPKADLWIGHSRGVDRLRFAPKGTKTIDLTPHEHHVSQLVMKRQDDIRRAYGAPNIASLPDHLKLRPPPHHFFITKEMKREINKKADGEDAAWLGGLGAIYGGAVGAARGGKGHRLKGALKGGLLAGALGVGAGGIMGAGHAFGHMLPADPNDPIVDNYHSPFEPTHPHHQTADESKFVNDTINTGSITPRKIDEFQFHDLDQRINAAKQFRTEHSDINYSQKLDLFDKPINVYDSQHLKGDVKKLHEALYGGFNDGGLGSGRMVLGYVPSPSEDVYKQLPHLPRRYGVLNTDAQKLMESGAFTPKYPNHDSSLFHILNHEFKGHGTQDVHGAEFHTPEMADVAKRNGNFAQYTLNRYELEQRIQSLKDWSAKYQGTRPYSPEQFDQAFKQMQQPTSHDVPEDVQQLRDVLKDMTPDDRIKTYQYIKGISPGVVQNAKSFSRNVA